MRPEISSASASSVSAALGAAAAGSSREAAASRLESHPAWPRSEADAGSAAAGRGRVRRRPRLRRGAAERRAHFPDQPRRLALDDRRSDRSGDRRQRGLARHGRLEAEHCRLGGARLRLVEAHAGPDGRRGGERRRFGDVERSARVRDQRRKLLQSPDLIGNDPPHRFGGLACLLWQIEDAAAQFLSRLIELALNLARHLLHLAHRLAEAVGGVLEGAGELGVGLFEGRLQRLRGPLALLGRGVANGFELAGDGDRRAPGGRGEGGADLLGASLRPGEAVLDVGGEPPERRLERFAAAGEIADERLQTALAMFEREIDRALLLGEIPSGRGQGFRVLGELRGDRAGVGLGGGGNPAERRDLRSDGAERMLEFVDPRREPALDGGKPVAGRSDRPIDHGAGLSEIVDHQRQFVAQPVAGAGKRPDRVFRAAGDRVAQRGA